MVRRKRGLFRHTLLMCSSYYEIAYTAAKDANKRLGFRKGHQSLIKELEFSSEEDFRPAIITEFLTKSIEKLPKDEVVADPKGLKQKAKALPQKISSGARSLVLGLIKVAQAMDPLISVFLPSSPEYAIPYACLKVIFVVSQIRLPDITSLRLTEVSSLSKKLRKRNRSRSRNT
jgi:hypothetical protein